MCKEKTESTKAVVNCQVVENREIAVGIYKITIGGESVLPICKDLAPGQFINVYMKDKSTLLPRPISICNIEKDAIELVYKVVGKGTGEMSGYKRGDSIRISSPLGNGFRLDADGSEKRAVLVAGGVGVPPMIELAKALKKLGMAVTGVFGFQEEPFLIREMEAHCDRLFIATENGMEGFHGNVIQLMVEQNITGDEFYSCGPKPMLKALALACEEMKVPVQVSLEERMGCGYGACVGCTCRIKEGEKVVQKAVCKDGPVFKGNEVVWDE